MRFHHPRTSHVTCLHGTFRCGLIVALVDCGFNFLSHALECGFLKHDTKNRKPQSAKSYNEATMKCDM